MRTAALLILAVAVALATGRDTASAALLVQLRPSAVCDEAAALQSAGAVQVVPELRVWRVHSARLVRELERRDAIRLAQRERAVTRRLAVQKPPAPDPLSAEEWWRPVVGVSDLTPPGPGVPVTVVDSGLAVDHPEFSGRPHTSTLNPQEPAPLGGEHGTAVASVIAAPANGRGIVGIYPEAELRSWDSARGDGTELETVEIVNGILEAARRGPSVINLSLGGSDRDPLIEQAVMVAIAKGSLVVAAAGNDGDVGSPLGYPAVLPHVVTVAATNRAGAVASFSSRSPYVDVAAPGAGILVATTLGGGWAERSGTSFSAPLVSGAAAWVWTARPELDADQVAEVLRRSARDIAARGRDSDSGFGMLDVAAALEQPAPIRDPLEPNEDVDLVTPGGADAVSVRPLTTQTRVAARLVARLDPFEDPRDVYRVWLPPRRSFSASATTTQGRSMLELSLWRAGVPTVATRFPGTDRTAVATGDGTVRLRVGPERRGRWAYLLVRPKQGRTPVQYRLAVTPR